MVSNTRQGGLTDTENARSLARRMFKLYNKDLSGDIEDYEVSSMISDVYKAIGKDYNPTKTDIDQYIKTVDFDGDGKVSVEDLE